MVNAVKSYIHTFPSTVYPLYPLLNIHHCIIQEDTSIQQWIVLKLHSTFFLWLSPAVFGEVPDESHHCFFCTKGMIMDFSSAWSVFTYIYTHIYIIYIICIYIYTYYVYIHIQRFSDSVCIVIESRMCDHILRYTCTIPRSEFPHLET